MKETREPAMNDTQRPNRTNGLRLLKRLGMGLGVIALLYLIVAYIILPAGWFRYEHRHPSLSEIPTITRTGNDIPGDPLNIALIGSEVELKKVVIAAKWYPADPLTLKSCLEIAEATVMKRPYPEAPVSNLYLFGRKEDLAFEKPVGDNPRQRHHVRFWRSQVTAEDGRPVWVGSATFDERVGLSHTTGQVTHHIAPNIDAERDQLLRDLRETGDLGETFVVTGFQKAREGKNGGGDPWHTDGNLDAGVIKPANSGPSR